MLGGRVCDGFASSKNVLRFAGAFVLSFGFFFGILFPKSPTSKFCIHVGMSLLWGCGCSPGCPLPFPFLQNRLRPAKTNISVVVLAISGRSIFFAFSAILALPFPQVVIPNV